MPRPRLTEPRYRLRRRANGIFTLSWTDLESRKTVAVSTGETEEAAAQVWCDQYIAGLQQPAPPPPQPLLSEILDFYLENRKGQVEAFDTLEGDAKALRRHVGNLEPHMLTPRMYWERRAKEAVSDGTIRRESGTLRAALAVATRAQPPWIDRAPHVEMPPRPPPRERWLTKEEVGALIAGARTLHVRLFIMLAYHTAARAGAILELTWDRVDLEHGRIDYHRPGRRQTRKRRATVPINSSLLSALKDARNVAIESAEKRGEEQPAPYLLEFRGRAPNSIKRGFAAACERAKIADCTPHTLRHTAATHMVMAGVPLAEVARMLGDSEAMVERVYGKHSPDYLRRAADALAGDFGPRLISPTMSQKKPD